jgi:hypothetical protein
MKNCYFMLEFRGVIAIRRRLFAIRSKFFAHRNIKNLRLFIKSKCKILFYLEQNKIYKKIEIFICVKYYK